MSKSQNSILRHIPNLLTSLNASTGMLAIILALSVKNGTYYAAYLILIAAVFDFLDGFAARLLNASSPIGKELDSLADMVSFGVAPAAIMFKLLQSALGVNTISLDVETWKLLILFSPILIVVFTALRLANFNVDERQTDSFIGLASPANAFFIASLALIDRFDPDTLWYIQAFDLQLPFHFLLGVIGFQIMVLTNAYFLLTVTIISAFLVVANIPMFSFKFKNFTFADNKVRFIFIGISVVFLLLLGLVGIAFIIGLYIFVSIIDNIIKKRKQTV